MKAALAAAALVAAVVLPQSASSESSPTLEQLIGNWEWVSTLWGWSWDPWTPETEGYSQRVLFYQPENEPVLYEVWYRDEAQTQFLTHDLPSSDLGQLISWTYGSLTLDGTTLTIDSYNCCDGPKHVLERMTPVGVAPQSWSRLKLLSGKMGGN